MTVPATAITEEASLARSSRAKVLRAGLAGDLTSILSKGLAEAPDESYDNVQSFAADLGNWLAGNAGHRQAGEPGLSRRQIRSRHSTAVTLTASAFLALIATTGSAVYQARLACDRYTDLLSSRHALFSGFIALVQCVLIYVHRCSPKSRQSAAPYAHFCAFRTSVTLFVQANPEVDAELQVRFQTREEVGPSCGCPMARLTPASSIGNLGLLTVTTEVFGWSAFNLIVTRVLSLDALHSNATHAVLIHRDLIHRELLAANIRELPVNLGSGLQRAGVRDEVLRHFLRIEDFGNTSSTGFRIRSCTFTSTSIAVLLS